MESEKNELTPLSILNDIETELKQYFVERDDEIRGLSISILSDNNMLLIGPPGIAKSMVVYSWSKHIRNYNFFAALLTKFSTPEELAGPFSIGSLDQDKYIRQTAGMLPEANVAFLDETFNGNSGILNFLLTLMNERIFYNDGKPVKVPLLTLVGASNRIPEPEDGLDAMYDRFLLKFEVSPIKENDSFMKMLELNETYDPKIYISLDQIMQAKSEVKGIHISPGILLKLCDLREAVHKDGILTTDRTFKKSINICKAEAYLNGHAEVQESDLDILKHVLWSDPDDQKKCYTNILQIINPNKNKVLSIVEKCSIEYDKFVSTTDNNRKTDLGSELILNLKESKSKIHEYYEKAELEGVNANEILQFEKKVHGFLKSTYSELGINF